MKQKNAELLVKEVFEDFQRRKEERSRLEASWLMNINFLMGNQYCELASNGEIFDNGNSTIGSKGGVQPYRANNRNPSGKVSRLVPSVRTPRHQRCRRHNC